MNIGPQLLSDRVDFIHKRFIFRGSMTSKTETGVIQLHGRLDVQGGRVLQQQIAAMEKVNQPFWALDLGNVDFIDSAGLVALIEAFQTAAQAGSNLVLCGVRPAARLILDITQLDQVFTIFNSYEEFLSSLPQSAVVLREPALV
jgi:anti-sigma B factor antagonist